MHFRVWNATIYIISNRRLSFHLYSFLITSSHFFILPHLFELLWKNESICVSISKTLWLTFFLSFFFTKPFLLPFWELSGVWNGLTSEGSNNYYYDVRFQRLSACGWISLLYYFFNVLHFKSTKNKDHIFCKLVYYWDMFINPKYRTKCHRIDVDFT